MGTIDLNLLGVFVAVAETAGFSAAARRLGVPKSSVSRAIAKLEADTGVQLIHRTTRQVALSSAGAALLERVSPLLASLRESVAGLSEADGRPTGTLKLTAPVDFGASVLAAVVARFTARYPQVQVDLRLSNDLFDLVAEGVDLAVRITNKRLQDSSLTARSVGHVHWQFVAAPEYLRQHGIPTTAGQLAAHEWIVFRKSTSFRIEGPNGSAEVIPQGRVLCDDLSFVQALACAGGGIGALPSYLAEPDVAAGRLVRLLPSWSLSGGTIWLVAPAGRHVPAKAAAFREMLVEHLASS